MPILGRRRNPFLASPFNKGINLQQFIEGAQTKALITHNVKVNNLFGYFRLDAEAYTPELIWIYEHLESMETVRLGDHAFITDGQHGYHIVDPNSPIRHLTARCIKDWFVDDSQAERLALETHEQNLRSSCEENDLLLSTAGTLANAAIVTNDVLPANMDQDIARIHLRTEIINPWFLVAFLNSRVGRLQSQRVSTGQVQQHIALGKIHDFLVPINVDQEEVAKVIKQAFLLRTASNNMFSQAQSLLFDELGIDNLDLSHQLTYQASFSSMAEVGRLDAEYFQPKYSILQSHIQTTKQWGKLEDWVAEPITRGTQPDYYEDGNVLVINSQHVGKTHVETTDNRLTSHKFLAEKRYKGVVKQYDVLLNSTGYNTIGRCQVLLEDIDAMVDGHVSIIRPKEGLDPVYLALYLNMLMGQMQTEQHWTGSSGQIELRAEAINNYSIWIPDESLQLEIRTLIENAHQARIEAANLLEQAKEQVEEMVLGGASA